MDVGHGKEENFARSTPISQGKMDDGDHSCSFKDMLHHASIAVSDLPVSAVFYDAVFTPLGYIRVWADKKAIGYGLPGGNDKFAVKSSSRGSPTPAEGFHIAFTAPTRQSVAEFYTAALEHGGKDNGGSGLHPEYGENYYAAFVFDPDGYRIEAVINKAV
jgi:catechol 2,3-dioxygenase-like lactoylglutathione lyase family enzyme